MPQERSESSEYSWTRIPWVRSGAAGARSGATIRVAVAVRPSGASAWTRCTPSGGRPVPASPPQGTAGAASPAPSPAPGGAPSSGSSRSRVPGGNEPSSTGGLAPAHHTSTRGSSRCAASCSAAARSARTVSGVAVSAPSCRSTAATVASGTRTVTSSAGW